MTLGETEEAEGGTVLESQVAMAQAKRNQKRKNKKAGGHRAETCFVNQQGRVALMLQVSGLQGRALSGLQMRRQRSWRGRTRTRASSSLPLTWPRSEQMATLTRYTWPGS